MRLRRIIFIVISFIFLSAFACAHATKLATYFSPKPILQGQAFTVTVYADDSVKDIDGGIFGKRIAFFREKEYFRAYIGVPVDASPDKYRLILNIEKADGTKTATSYFVTVNKREFGKVSFKLKPAKQYLLAEDIVEADWEKIQKELVKSGPKRMWFGPFQNPALGYVSMKFGTHQFINGKVSGQHRGLDIAGKSYYRVRAANHGQVVLAERLEAFGNTVVVNHGRGVFSLYFHLSKIDVKKNDIVWKGKVVGLMGQTGVATGVHLHFAMSVADVRVDPVQWMYGGIWE
jgi:murein DD-endopeptidase MepM/ murein hydrolase activator NlpD